MIRRLGIRCYKAKGTPNKQELTPIDVEYVQTKGLDAVNKVRRSKYVDPELLPTIENLECLPNSFTSIHTDRGWFVIPKIVYTYRWTKEEVSKVLDQHSDLSQTELQKHIIEWVKQVDILQIPQIDKPTAKDKIKQEDDAIYRSQLKDDYLEVPTSGGSKKTTRETPLIRRSVNYTHAWNYFSSIFHRESGLDRKEILRRWKEMNMEQKEEYRLQYSELLKSGRDIHKGQIISVEEKLKINAVHQKSKQAKRERDDKKAEEVAGLLRARDVAIRA